MVTIQVIEMEMNVGMQNSLNEKCTLRKWSSDTMDVAIDQYNEIVADNIEKRKEVQLGTRQKKYIKILLVYPSKGAYTCGSDNSINFPVSEITKLPLVFIDHQSKIAFSQILQMIKSLCCVWPFKAMGYPSLLHWHQVS